MDIENTTQLQSYLVQHNHIHKNEPLKTGVLEGGVSNRTVWIQRENGEEWVLKQALEKLRVKVDWFCSPERVHREALGIRWLEKIAPSGSTVPLIFEDHENHIIAMNAVPQPHQNWKTMLLNGEIADSHFIQFAEILAVIHRESSKQKSELSNVFADRSYFEQLRLEPFYEYPALQIDEAKPFLLRLMDETRQVQSALVHGDYSPKNILVYNDKLILLDHEVIHFGDPAFDIGFAMAHFLSKALAVNSHRDSFIQASKLFWSHYKDEVEVNNPKELEHRCVYHTLGCILARAAGRSTMDYFNDAHKKTQTQLSIQLMKNAPSSILELIDQLKWELENYV